MKKTKTFIFDPMDIDSITNQNKGNEMIMLMVPKNMTAKTKRDFLIQIYEMLFSKLGMNDRIDAVRHMILHAPKHQIDLEVETLENGSFQKVVSAMINCELNEAEIDHVRALYEGIFRPYMENGGRIPKADLEWAYNEIFQFTESVHRKRLAAKNETTTQLASTQQRIRGRE